MADKVAEKINKIRLANGWDGKTCTTCTRSIHSPYRRHDARGHVTEGCVDASHDGHLHGESLRWHNRPEAKEIRKYELLTLQGK